MKLAQLLLIIPLFATLLKAQIQNNVTLSAASDTGVTNDIKPFTNMLSCSCDYLANICDTYCCCDTTDCAEDLLTSWMSQNLCTNTTRKGQAIQMCRNSTVLAAYVNPKEQQSIDISQVSSLFCIEYTKAPYAGYFYVEDNSVSQTNTLESNFYTKNMAVISAVDALSTTNTAYTRGQKVFSQLIPPNTTVNVTYARFTVPKPDPLGFCEGTYSAMFLQDMPPTSCLRRVTFGQDCFKDSVLSEAYYTSLISLLSYPDIDADSVEQVTVRNVILMNGASEADPTYVAGTTPICACRNIVKRVDYVITYNSQLRITAVRANVVMENVISNDCSVETTVEQTFSVKYVTSTRSAIPKSGNPGYIMGMPLIIGQANSGSTPSVNRPIAGIIVSGISDTGACLFANSGVYRKDITFDFGKNSSAACFVSLANASALATYCTNTSVRSVQLFNNFEGSYLIGRFGNSNINRIQDWIPLDQYLSLSNTTTSYNSTTGICTLPLDEEIYVFYAEYGLSKDPQNYIVRTVRTFNYRNYTYNPDATSNFLEFTQKFKYIKVNERTI